MMNETSKRRPNKTYKAGRKGWRARFFPLDGMVHDTRPQTDHNPLWVKRCEPRQTFIPSPETKVVDDTITCLVCVARRM